MSQDYGYWYGSGALWPNFASCYIAVDATDQANGCLKVRPSILVLATLDIGRTDGRCATRVYRR